MDRQTFRKFRDIVYRKSGIFLGDAKIGLASARFNKRMRDLGLTDYRDYLARVINDESGEEMVHLLDAISTNVTDFFREKRHFDFLAETYRLWLGAGQRRFRLWSAACASGEEPYSIAMTMLAASDAKGVDLRILATDISTRALAAGVRGEYPEDKAKTIPKSMLRRYFTTATHGSGMYYVAKAALKNRILFRRLNLSQTPFPMRGPLDVIFCRNVMIYFDDEVRRRLLAQMYGLLKPGGFLFVGLAESLTGQMSKFKIVSPSIYIKE